MASAREYRNLKEYRDKELKWFLLANIILMLIGSGVLDFGKLDSISISDISSLLGITAVSSAIYIYTFILDSILPSRVKVFLVFLWKRQPSCTIFTDMEQKFEDDHSQTIVTIFAYIILWWFSGVLSFSWKFVIYLIIMTACLNIGARVQGKKMVYNVLSIDVNESVLEDRTKNDKQNI